MLEALDVSVPAPAGDLQQPALERADRWIVPKPLHLVGRRNDSLLHDVLRGRVIQPGLARKLVNQPPVRVEEVAPTVLVVPVLEPAEQTAAGGNEYVFFHWRGSLLLSFIRRGASLFCKKFHLSATSFAWRHLGRALHIIIAKDGGESAETPFSQAKVTINLDPTHLSTKSVYLRFHFLLKVAQPLLEVRPYHSVHHHAEVAGNGVTAEIAFIRPSDFDTFPKGLNVDYAGGEKLSVIKRKIIADALVRLGAGKLESALSG
jgi:hypothetical protein